MYRSLTRCQNYLQNQNEESSRQIYELSQISIESNVAEGKRGFIDDPSTRFQSTLPGSSRQDITMRLTKPFILTTLPQDNSLGYGRSMHQEPVDGRKNRKISPDLPLTRQVPLEMCAQKGPNFSQLVEWIKKQEERTQAIEQRYFTQVFRLQYELKNREQKSQEMKAQLDDVKKELNKTKKDMNELISIVKEITLNGQRQVQTERSHREAQSKSPLQKSKKMSNDKSTKKINSPGKKGIQVKQKSPTTKNLAQKS